MNTISEKAIEKLVKELKTAKSNLICLIDTAWQLGGHYSGEAEFEAFNNIKDAREQIAKIEEIEAIDWVEEYKQMSVGEWYVDDVLEAANDEGITITEEEAREILQGIEKNFDAMTGINWDTVYEAVNEFAKERARNEGNPQNDTND